MDTVPEVRAGYYVSTQDRPAFETDLTSEELDSVFDQMYEDHERWQQNSNGHPPSQNGNGQLSEQNDGAKPDPK